jgi:PAS domain S-box-containing protein
MDPEWARGLAGLGEMGDRIRSFDWSSTPLGPIDSWPPSLRGAVSLCLRSRFQLALYWGPELIHLYNDAEREILGVMHPSALGRPAAETLADSWNLLGPLLRGVLAGSEATWSVDQPLRLNRRGMVEESYFTYSYSAIPDGDKIGGVLLVTTETTERVLAQRRLRVLGELAAGTAHARGVDEVSLRFAEVLADHRSDIPFSLLFLAEGEDEFRLYAKSGVAKPIDAGAWPLRDVAASRQAILLRDVASRFHAGEVPPSRAALVLPIASAGMGPAAGCLVAGLSDVHLLDDPYRGFLDLVAGQLATAIAAARSFDEERRRLAAVAELDVAKTAFFANVSHEFRTPLTLLLGPLEDTLAQPGDALSPEDRERLTLAHHNARRLLKLVNMLLEFARIEAGRVQAGREPTDLAALTAGLVSQFRSSVERAGIRLIVDCPPLSRPAAVDRVMWEKIVLNLVSNAFKFTQEGEIAVTLRQVGDAAELSVRDTGVGIPEGELPRIFGRFHQVPGVPGRSLEGTGIGLALVQELVRLHGGSIRVESTHGQGSRFIVSVPLDVSAPAVPAVDFGRAVPASYPWGAGPYVAEATRWLPDLAQADVSTPSCPEGAEAGVGAGPRGQVLVADDNADMRRYLGRLLAGAYDVRGVSDGLAALAAARDRPPDLILADVMMPGLDGFGLLRELRTDPRTRTVPVVFLSARAGEESRLEGLRAGADDYLVKPFSARELLARVKAHLELARIRREASRRESDLRAKVRQAQEQAAAILESITDGFLALDNDWRFTHVNAAAERISGIRREDQIGKNYWELFPAARGTILESEWRRAVAEQVPVEFENRYEPWDSWFHVKAYPSKDGGLSVFYHDITSLKRSEEALRRDHSELERRVLDRTRELSQANARLERQIARRRRVEAARTELLRRLVHSQEDQHRRIARELHDDVTQRLATLAIDAGIIEQSAGCPAEIGDRAHIMYERLAALSESLHTLSRQLHPSILDELGLVDALRSECTSLYRREGIRVAFHARGVPREVPAEVALCVYRVAQESLRNVARHARCRRAAVRLDASAGALVLRVRDRGAGFQPGARGRPGLGLESMRERARLARARLTIRSKPGEGTRIVLRVPLHEDPT